MPDASSRDAGSLKDEHRSIAAGLEAIRAWEADHGRLSDEEIAEADRILDWVLRASPAD